MEKEKKNNFRPLAAERPGAAMFVLIFCPWNSSSETQGQIVGPKTKIRTGGKKFDDQKYERKIRAPGDKLFTHQFQTAERILAPDFSAQSKSNDTLNCSQKGKKVQISKNMAVKMMFPCKPLVT